MTDILSGIIGSIFWLYLATILVKNDYGEIQFLISNVGLAVGFAMIANTNSLIVYEVKQRDLRKTLFSISFILGMIVSIVLFFLYSRFDLVLLVFGMMLEEMIVGYFLGKKSFIRYSIFIILQKILMIVLGIGLYFVIGVEGIIYGIGLSYLVLLPIILKIFSESHFDIALFRQNFGFIINNYSIRLIVFSRRNIDKIIIVPILGTAVLGEYALAFQLYMAMMLFGSISSKFLLVSDAAKTNSNKFKIFVFSISTAIALLGITIAPIIVPMLFPNYTGIIDIIPIFSLTIIPNTIVIIYSSKFLGDEKSRFTLIGGLSQALIYILLIVILGPMYGLFGLSLSFLISSTIYAVFLVIMHKIQKL
ncbi:MAG: hypothetical protein QXN55_03915 [Candidatus Nitrosotenuis sp.]